MHFIRWIVIYLVDKVIQPLNNWGLYDELPRHFYTRAVILDGGHRYPPSDFVPRDVFSSNNWAQKLIGGL